jgi:hypothetical protein
MFLSLQDRMLKGIDGHGTITRTLLHDLASGGHGLVNHHKLSWQIR